MSALALQDSERKRTLARPLLAVSLGLHAVTALALTVHYLRPRTPPSAGEYAASRRSLFAELPISRGSTVFVGDSITDRAEWAELLGRSDVVNRGIAGETVVGAEAWIESVTRHEPNRIVLLLGVNDLLSGRGAEAIANDYDRLLTRVKERAPRTRLLVLGVLPIGAVTDAPNVRPSHVTELNDRLGAVAAKHGAVFADVGQPLANDNGSLRPELSTDGVHLNGEGYVRLAKSLEPWISGN